MPPQVLQHLLGHADVSTTMQFYVFLRTEDARVALEKVSPLPAASTQETPQRAVAGGIPCAKARTALNRAARKQESANPEVSPDQGLAGGGPCRTRTYDQLIMSQLL